jgi:hydroxysqualene dehydroxylase
VENLAAHLSASVAIIGGGWAGLACAVECVQRGLRPTVFEAAPQLGGRARTVEFDGLRLDNGQHILIGAYHDTLRAMRHVGADPDVLLRRQPLALRYSDGFELRARSGSRAALAIAFLCCRSLGWHDRLAALRMMRAIKHTPDADETVAAMLVRTGQTGNTVRHLWAPLCIAALNTEVAQASARVFACVLRESLNGAAGDADLLLPQADLGQLFPEPAAAWLAARGHAPQRGTRVRSVRAQGDGFTLDTGDAQPCFDRVVFATSPHHLPALLRDLPALEAIARRVAALDYEPITTVYAAFDAHTRLPAAMTGFAEGLPHWVFDRGALGGPQGLTASVISAVAALPDGGREQSERAVLHALRTHHPALAEPLWVRTITERRATFRCTPGRASIGQPDDARLAIAGDYLLDDYPATIEAAVRSGTMAAARIAGPRRIS